MIISGSWPLICLGFDEVTLYFFSAGRSRSASLAIESDIDVIFKVDAERGCALSITNASRAIRLAIASSYRILKVSIVPSVQ